MDKEREDFIEGLRDLADFYEERALLPVPTHIATFSLPYCNSKEELVQMALLFKPCEKDFTGSFKRINRKFGPLTLQAAAWRGDVCERVVTGTRTVAEQITPAQEVEIVPEHEEDIVEWKCPDSLLGD